MSKRTIWLKGSEIRKMTNKQIANYEFNTRIADPDEPSDHELLKQLAKNQASDHELLKRLVTKVNNIETRLTNVEDILKRNNLH